MENMQNLENTGEIVLQCRAAFDLFSSRSVFYHHFLSLFVDVNECDSNPCEGKGRCVNSYGSYSCQCNSGYSQVITQNRKFCQGETILMTAINMTFW